MKHRSQSLTGGKYYTVKGPNGVYCIFADSHYHAINQAITRDGNKYMFRFYKLLRSENNLIFPKLPF